MTSNDFIYLFQYLYGQLALGLFGLMFALLVWDAGVTAYRRRKWEALEEISLEEDPPVETNQLEKEYVTS